MLQKRSSGIYYFRWCIPLHLRPHFGKREVYISLRTKDKLSAIRKLASIAPNIEKMKAMVKTKRDKDKISELQRKRDLIDQELDVLETDTTTIPTDPEHLKPNNQVLKNHLMASSIVLSTLSSLEAPTSQQESGPTLTLNIKGLWDQYCSEKIATNRWKRDGNYNDYQSYFSDFLEITGFGGPPITLDNDLAIKVLNGIKNTPVHRQKRFAGIPLSSIPQDAEKLSERSVQQRLAILKGFFKWLHIHGHHKKNPLDNMVVSIGKTNTYATYTTEDIQSIFNLPPEIENTMWRFWIPRLALFTGARKNEILQLKPSDIFTNDSGIACISINKKDGKSVKSSAGVRIVPLHSTLIENNFLKYVSYAKKQNKGTLWPDFLGTNLDRAVGNYWCLLKKKGVPTEPTDNEGCRKVFHSLRRVFINKLYYTENSDLGTLQAIVGHEPGTALKETRTYIDQNTDEAIQKTKSLLEGLRFSEKINWNYVPRLNKQHWI